MKFFDSLQQLGYSSLNLFLVFMLVILVIHRTFRKQLSGQIARAAFFAVAAALFVFTINYLAEVNSVAFELYKTKRATEQSNTNN